MLVLVLGASFPVMFVGWEGVGLCSYLLIGFWFTKPSAADAGKKAFIVNRVGDFGFILGCSLIFATFGTLDFQARAPARRPRCRPRPRSACVTLITMLLFVGATGKSAQIPLYVWLPDAMEGPTPVSALIHAATMVTAGVYMIGRNAVLFSHAPMTLDVVAVVGAFTALLAGTIGLVQNDIKRVLAYSTVSQLGYMFLAMGVGAFAAGIFHLYTHAFFKALLFLGSGAVIHALHGEQDLRHMGGLRKELPITFWTFLDRHARDCRRAAALGLLLEGRDPLEDLRATAHTVLWALAVRDRVSDRHLHVPPALHGVLRRAPSARPAEHGTGTRHAATTPSGHGHARMAMAAICTMRRRRWRSRSSCWRSARSSAGYVGMPHALVHGGNRIEAFLAPSFQARRRSRRRPRPVAAAPLERSRAARTHAAQSWR